MLLPGGTHDHLALDDVGSEDVNSDGDSENYDTIAESKLASLVALYFCLQLLITRADGDGESGQDNCDYMVMMLMPIRIKSN